MNLPRIQRSPKAFKPQADVFNLAMHQLEGVLNFTSNDKTVKFTMTDNNTDFSAGPNGGGGPPGGTFEEFTICDSGTPATRWWKTWLTDPS